MGANHAINSPYLISGSGHPTKWRRCQLPLHPQEQNEFLVRAHDHRRRTCLHNNTSHNYDLPTPSDFVTPPKIELRPVTLF